MDENVKPGDGKPRPIEEAPEDVSNVYFAFKWIGIYLLILLLFPLLVVFYLPVRFAIKAFKMCYRTNGYNLLASILGFISSFLLWLLINAFMSPVLVAVGLSIIISGPIIGVAWLCCGCKVPDNGYSRRKEARERNQKAAEERMKNTFNNS